MKKARIKTSKDGKVQPALFYVPADASTDKSARPVPLVVGLHTWGTNYRNHVARQYLAQCRKRNWSLIHPDFRGPNTRPEACASDLAVQDVLDAVRYACRKAHIDERRIYLVGVSGGGHMVMMMASRAPKLWAAASAWVGVSDLAAWHEETKTAGNKYWRMVEKVCGGPPGASAQVDTQYRKRSPLFGLHKAAGVPIDINAGIRDGHTGSVPISQSLRAFNALAKANGKAEKILSDTQIDFMTQRQAVPAALACKKQDTPTRRHKVLFRRQAGPARVTIFGGGHEIDVNAAFDWLATRSRRPKR